MIIRKKLEKSNVTELFHLKKTVAFDFFLCYILGTVRNLGGICFEKWN